MTKIQIPQTDWQTASQAIDVQGDWCYATYLMAAAAIGAKVHIQGLDMFEDAMEKRIFEALHAQSSALSIQADAIIAGRGLAHAFQFSLAGADALALPLIVMAAGCNGTSVLSEWTTVVQPELWAERLEVLQSVGLDVKVQDDLLIIPGNSSLHFDKHVHTNDALLLGALALLAIQADGEKTLSDATALLASFPNWISDMNRLLGQPIIIAP